jgi:DNA-directed RNA polymerase subunit RPC12/RpoP
MHASVYATWCVMDKTEGNPCPRCGLKALSIYYEEGSDLQLGARCDECGLKGFFMNGKLVPLATV